MYVLTCEVQNPAGVRCDCVNVQNSAGVRCDCVNVQNPAGVRSDGVRVQSLAVHGETCLSVDVTRSVVPRFGAGAGGGAQ